MLRSDVIKHGVLTALTVSALVLAGCHSSQLGPPHDVAYFKAHTDERQAVIHKCTNDPSELAQQSNCVNAFDADKQVMFSDPISAPSLPKDRLIGSPAAATSTGKYNESH